jgi:PAS domain S-box-containing protein
MKGGDRNESMSAETESKSAETNGRVDDGESVADLASAELLRGDSKSPQDDLLITQILPGLVAVICIIIVVGATIAGERVLVQSARQNNLHTMEIVLENTVRRFEGWASEREDDVRELASSRLITDAFIAHIRESELDPVLFEELVSGEAAVPWDVVQARLRENLGAWIIEEGYRGYSLISLDGTILASMRDSDLGAIETALHSVELDRVVSEGVLLTHPVIVDQQGARYDALAAHFTEEAMIYVVAPVLIDGVAQGFIALKIDPLGEFSAAFRMGRTGLTGETYVVDRHGRLLSESRYEPELIQAGVLTRGHVGMLHLDVRDPGVDLMAGGTMRQPHASGPLTRSAGLVSLGQSGNDMQGYRDYRGVPVIGVWVWDERYALGVITEIDVHEAFSGVREAQAVLRLFAVAMAISFTLLALLFSVHRRVSRQRAQVTLRAKQRLSQILNTAAEGIYGIDGEGVITFVNSRACMILGFSEEELIGKNMHALVHHTREDGGVYPNEECPIHTPFVASVGRDTDVFWTRNGEAIPIEYACSPLDPVDKTIGAVITFRDISKRKRDENSLRRYAQELKRSNSELQEFAYAASHDLQEPLRKIQAFGERLNAKYRQHLDEPGQHYLDRMVDASTRMRHLIDDLLSYSRVNARSSSYVPVDLGTVLADVVGDLEPRIAATGASLKIADLPAIEADPAQMHQLFLNMLGNSLKFHRTDVAPIITLEASVEVSEQGAVVRLTLTDNGIGFELRHSERIFGMFERLHGRDTYHGTGVGLATCRKIVAGHSGSLMAWGEPGAGAVFTLILPIQQANLA